MTGRYTDATAIREDVFSDTDLSADLKLFTLAAIHLWETSSERRKVKTFKRENWAYKALRLTGETGTTEELTPQLRWMIRDDVPKYRLDFSQPTPCGGTMLRPAGAPCKRQTYSRTTIVNPMTGERTLFGSCRDERHERQATDQIRAALAAWEANGKPEPKPNSGGRLLRYFTSGIEALYAWADQDYTAGTKVPEPPTQNFAGIVSLADHRNRKDT